MRKSTRQLYILCDLEGASGITPKNKKAINHSSELWHHEGRGFITSDVQAAVEAVSEFGIDEIILNDSHDNGRREPNVLMKELPDNVRLVKRPYLLGKPHRIVRGEPYGIIMVGQHAMHGGGGFVPHTISAPFGEVTINGLVVGEIGLELATFMGARLLAVVGEEAAVKEARTLCPNVVGVPVKSLEREWFPPASEMKPVIRERVLDALRRRDEMDGLHLKAPYRFTLRAANGYCFDPNKKFFSRSLARLFFFGRCNGQIDEDQASWQTKTVIGGLYALFSTRAFMRKQA